MNIDYKEVGKRIAKRRKELGLKQFQVNEMAGLSDKYISHIETARTIPSTEVLMKICIALDTTPNSLLLGSTTISIDQQLIEKLKMIKTDKQKEVLNHFMDWVIDQDF